MAEQRWIDIGMNEVLSIREGTDEPFVILWPLDPGPHFGNYYPVVIAEQSDGRWRAQVPTMPQCGVYAATREEAKEALAASIRRYLRKRVGFIEDAAPLVRKYIVQDDRPVDADHDGQGAYISPTRLPVWRLIGEMGDALSASSVGDDSLVMDAERIAAVAKRLGISDDAARAAVAYYLDHEAEIRAQIAEDRHARLDAAFEPLSDEDKQDAENLDQLLGVTDDHS